MKNFTKIIGIVCALALVLSAVYCVPAMAASPSVQYETFTDATVGATGFAHQAGTNPHFSYVEKDGDKMLHFEYNAYSNFYYNFPNITLEGGKSYNLQFKTPGGGAAFDFKICAQWVDELKNCGRLDPAKGSFSFDFDVPAGKGGYLSIYTGAPDWGVKNVYMDDFVLTEIVDGATTGNVLTNVNGVVTVCSDKTEFTPDAPAVAGKVFTGWFTDKACTVAYTGSVEAGKSVMIYAGFTDKVQVETFATKSGVYNGYYSYVDLDGNKALLSNVTSPDGYASGAVTIDSVDLVAGKTYKLSLQILDGNPRWLGIRSTAVTDDTDAGLFVNKTSVAVGANTFEFTVPEGKGGKLQLRMQNKGVITSTYHIDDIVVSLVDTEAVAGNVVAFSGDTAVVNYDVTEFVPEAPATLPTGKSFAGWYSDRALNVAYNGTVDAGETVSVYPGLVDTVQVETFAGKTGAINGYYSYVTTNGNTVVHVNQADDIYSSGSFAVDGINLVAGQTYTLSLEIPSGNPKYISVCANNSDNKLCTHTSSVIGTNVFDFTVPEGKGGKLVLFLENKGAKPVVYDIDDIVAAVVDENAEDGTAIVIDGDTITPYYNVVDEFVPVYETTVPEGMSLAFTTDKLGTTIFEGYVNPTQTVVLYPTFIKTVQVETFKDATVGVVPNTGNELSIVNTNSDKALAWDMGGYASKMYTFNNIALVSGKTYNLTFQSSGLRRVSIYSGANEIIHQQSGKSFTLEIGEGQGGLLGLHIENPWDSPMTGSLDDVVLTMVTTGAETGNVALFDGDDVTVTCNLTSYTLPAQPYVEGKIAKAFSDKACTALFDGNIVANATVSVYPGYVDALQYETFDTAASTRDGYWDETEGAMKIHYEGDYAGRGASVAGIQLLPNTTYAFSFQYKHATGGNFIDDGKQGFGISVATSRNDMFWTDHDTAMEQHITGNVALPATPEWKTVTGTFNTGSYVAPGKTMLALWGKTFNGTFDLYIDDVVVMEIDPANPVGGSVVKVDGSDVTVAYNQTSYVPAETVAPVEGKIGGWASNKSGSADFNSTIAQNSIAMLYKAYRDKFIYEDFSDAEVFSTSGTAVEEVDGNYVVAKSFDGTAWESGNFRTNIVLRPNTRYILTYKIFATAKNLNAYQFHACRGAVTDWQFWFKDYGSNGSDSQYGNIKTQTILSEEHLNDDGDMVKDYWLKEAGKWYTLSTTLDTTGIVDDKCNLLGVYLQSTDTGEAFEVYMDDFCLTEIEEEETTANFILVDADGVAKTVYGVEAVDGLKYSELFESSTVYGDDNFMAFCSSVERTDFIADVIGVEAGATYVVYATYAPSTIEHICELVQFNLNKNFDFNLDGNLDNGDVDVLINYLLAN